MTPRVRQKQSRYIFNLVSIETYVNLLITDIKEENLSPFLLSLN